MGKGGDLSARARAALAKQSPAAGAACCDPRFKPAVDAAIDAAIEARKEGRVYTVKQILDTVLELDPEFPNRHRETIGSHLRDHDPRRHRLLYGRDPEAAS